MAAKLSNAGKPKWTIEVFMPVLLSFGPLFLSMGLQNGIQTLSQRAMIRPNWLNYGEATIGVLMLSAGLMLLMIKQFRLEQRLNELERLKN